MTEQECVKWFEDWELTPETATQVLMNYSAFLCSMTGGKLSKIGYDLQTMESVANDYWQLDCRTCEYGQTANWKGWTATHWTGKYENNGDPEYKEYIYYTCSKCNRKTIIKEKYCPSCGSKMLEESGSEP